MVEEKTSKSKHHQKQEVMQEFQSKQKHHWVTILLCFFLGIVGGHRFYLQQPRRGVIIIGITLLVLVFYLVVKSGGYGIVMSIVFYIWLSEMFFASKNTDKANQIIRSRIEQMYEF